MTAPDRSNILLIKPSKNDIATSHLKISFEPGYGWCMECLHDDSSKKPVEYLSFFKLLGIDEILGEAPDYGDQPREVFDRDARRLSRPVVLRD